MLLDVPMIDYRTADDMTRRQLQARMWLIRYGVYDSTTQYVAAVTSPMTPAHNR